MPPRPYRKGYCPHMADDIYLGRRRRGTGTVATEIFRLISRSHFVVPRPDVFVFRYIGSMGAQSIWLRLIFLH